MADTEVTRVLSGGATVPATDRTMIAPAGFGATQQMPAGGMDALRTQMGGTTTCPVCRSTTPLSDPYCGECGFLYSSAQQQEIAPVAPEPEAAALVLPDGRRLRLRAGQNTLGRQGADVLLDDATISRNHARITVQDGGVTVEDLGSTNGTKVGDLRIGPHQPTPAPLGTPLRFGNCTVTLEGPSGAGDSDRTVALPSETPLGSPSVEESVEAGDGAVARLRTTDGPAGDITVREGVITVGRRPDASVVIAGDGYVSGLHVQLRTDLTGTYITDLGSTNGTVVNGQRLTAQEPQLLLEGDTVQIGRTSYRFELLEAPEAFEEEPETGSPGEPAEIALGAGPSLHGHTDPVAADGSAAASEPNGAPAATAIHLGGTGE